MNISNEKEIFSGDICKNHSSKYEKDMYRICPSNLDRRELEDLYYTLIDDNRDLKRTVNDQKEKLKVLSTKLLRLSAAQRSNSKKDQHRGPSNNVVVNGQNDIIEDLKKTNDRMSEKIRQLNMKLCSAKQFLRTSSIKCNKCTYNRKSSTLLNIKKSPTNIQQNSDISTQRSVTEQIYSAVSVKSVEINTENTGNYSSEGSCNNNKCKIQVEELKQKLISLEHIFSQLNHKYNEQETQNSSLKLDINKLKTDNTTLRVEVKSLQEKVREREVEVVDLSAKLTETESANSDLQVRLSIEAKKVIEMETQVKSLQVSNEVVKIIEEQLCTQLKRDSRHSECMECLKRKLYEEHSEDNLTSRLSIPCIDAVNLSEDVLLKHASTPVKSSNDSGYGEGRVSVSGLASVQKLNEELKQRVLNLQAELDLYKVSTAGQCNTILRKMTEDLECENTDPPSRKPIPFNSDRFHTSSSKFTERTHVSTEPDIPLNVITITPRKWDNKSVHSIRVNKESGDIRNNTDSSKIDDDVREETKWRTEIRQPCNSFENVTSKLNGVKNELPNQEYNKINRSSPIENTKTELKSSRGQQEKCTIKIVNENKKDANTIDRTDKDNITLKDTGSKIKNEIINKISKGTFINKQTNNLNTVDDSMNILDSQRAQKRHSLTHSIHKTYSVTPKNGATSPDNTDFDVSSISEFSSHTNRKQGPSEPLSLGEDRVTSSNSTSGPLSSSEFGYLSEGEIPLAKGTNLSIGEKLVNAEGSRRKSMSTNRMEHKENLMDSTLEAVRRELRLCQHLLKVNANSAAVT